MLQYKKSDPDSQLTGKLLKILYEAFLSYYMCCCLIWFDTGQVGWSGEPGSGGAKRDKPGGELPR